MRVVLAVVVLLFVVVLVQRDRATRRAPTAAPNAVAGTEAGTSSAASTSATARSDADGAASPAGKKVIDWGRAIEWMGWEEGLAAARQDGRPLCLVVYADWCQRCKELAPVFSRPQVAAMARGVIMVRQNQDEPAPWLQERFGEIERYVPRVLFLDGEGKLMPELQSGHPRYPYFYSHHVTDRLVANMHAAIGG